MKQIILIAMLVFAVNAKSQNAPGQKQQYSFSLQEAIAHALEHNYTSINAKRDIDKARQKKRETTAAGLPQINGAIDYINNFELQRQGVSSTTTIPGFPTGSGATTSSIQTFAFGTNQSVNARATLSQILFDGSYLVALQASKTYLKYYENYKLKTDVNVREMVTNDYGNVLLAEESVAILERNRSILDKTLSDTRETFKNGLIEEENVEQLEITLGSVNSNLNNTKRVLDIAYKMLKVTLGIDLNDDLKLTDQLDNLTVKNVDAAFSREAFDVSNNIDYKIAQNFEQQRRLELKQQKSTAMPSLSANYNFGYNAFEQTFRFLNENQKYYNYSSLGVSLNVPIFSSFGRSARIQQAKIALEQAKTQLTEAQQRLQLQYENAKSEYEFSVEEYATAKNNLRLAERIEGKQQTKFTEGLSSSFDFSEAQRQLYSAQQDYLQSMVNIISKKASLESVINK